MSLHITGKYQVLKVTTLLYILCLMKYYSIHCVILTTYYPRVRSLRENFGPRPRRIDRAIARSIRQGRGSTFSRKDQTFELFFFFCNFCLQNTYTTYSTNIVNLHLHLHYTSYLLYLYLLYLSLPHHLQ